MLEDGSVYNGEAGGKFKETVCEIIFNTSMAGYVELLSDPSAHGQGVVMTYPLIGNYGVCEEDMESGKLQPSALLVHELCDTPSNFRSEMTIDEFLVKYELPCIFGLDTRAIVMNLRTNGTMRGIITTDISDKAALMNKIKEFCNEKPVYKVTSDKPAVRAAGSGVKIAVLDLGVKNSIVETLASRGCTVATYPATTSAEEILNDGADGILLSGGPGDPNEYPEITAEIKKLFDSGKAIMGVGLGHQLAALANGGKAEKMKYGHRGTNHPVKFISEDKTYLTSQNHGYNIAADGIPENAEALCINVNDSTVEGLVYNDKPVFTVQFYPDADRKSMQGTAFLYDKFLKMASEGK